MFIFYVLFVIYEKIDYLCDMKRTHRASYSVAGRADGLRPFLFFISVTITSARMRRQLKKTDAILRLARDGRQLKKFVTETLPNIREAVKSRDKSGWDKHEDGFCLNEDAVQSLNLRLCYKSFSSSFGCSDTYSDIAGLDKDLMKEYLVKWLNTHKDEILLGMADMMVSDAKEQREVALDEIESVKASLTVLLDCYPED